MKSYTDRKEAWAEKMRARGTVPDATRSTDRLPPGQHLAQGKIPVLDLGLRPKVPLSDWTLELRGEVEAPISLTWEQLQALPQVETVTDFHCVTTWSAYDCAWGGVAMQTLLDMARPLATARFVHYTSYDGYTTNTAIEPLFGDGVLLCTRLAGKPLPADYGGPARVVIPQLYAWKSAKFIRCLNFRADDEPGYWERRGYSDTADPWRNDRFRPAAA